MANYPANIKKLLRTWSTEAYHREMERELGKLEKDIAAWKRGRISSEEISHRVHVWDTGPSKALSKQYDYGALDSVVAFAIVAGILKKVRPFANVARTRLCFFCPLAIRFEIGDTIRNQHPHDLRFRDHALIFNDNQIDQVVRVWQNRAIELFD